MLPALHSTVKTSDLFVKYVPRGEKSEEQEVASQTKDDTKSRLASKTEKIL